VILRGSVTKIFFQTCHNFQKLFRFQVSSAKCNSIRVAEPEWEAIGWRRIPNNTRSRCRIFLSCSESPIGSFFTLHS